MNDILAKLRLTSAKIADFLAEDPQVSSVILFGSGAYGVVSERSDIVGDSYGAAWTHANTQTPARIQTRCG